MDHHHHHGPELFAIGAGALASVGPYFSLLLQIASTAAAVVGAVVVVLRYRNERKSR